MPRPGLLGNRYRIEGAPIGQGGMGVVYRAFDTELEREVALKTIRGPVDAAAVEQFRKESRTLARLCHSNIVDIYDVGEFENQDGRKPYFVMPLLSGSNLSDLLKSSGSRLDAERLVGLICQACKALHAAHIKDVIHCDLKPSNLFVLEDDSVKVIDFGIRHLVGGESGTRLQGTLHYMSPEQFEGKVTPQSDIFSLGVVCYEALTGHKPFIGETEPEVIDAIRSHVPPSISELNPAVPHLVGQVVHRALAKRPYHRLSTAREFSDLLQRALRNESLPQFDRARIASRVTRIRKALAEGDCPYAREMLSELGSEGHVDHEISLLSIQVEDAIRARTVHQLLESARLRLEEEDYPLAAQKVQSVLDLDRDNIDALALKREIEEKRGTSGVEKWYQIARQHLDRRLFSKAREAVDEVLRIDQHHAGAHELLSDIKRGEQEQARLRQEIQRLYDSVLKAYGNGEISSALSKLERLIDLGKRVSGHPQTDAQYESLYNEIRRERDELQALYAEARKAVEVQDFSRAQEICGQVLDRRPADALFQALKIEIDEAERQACSGAIAELHHQIEIEADLDRKLQLVKQAVSQFPDEQTFVHSLKLVRQKRDLVNSICGRARHYASQGQFADARNQWDILRNIYPQYPGLNYETERLNRDQQQSLEEQAKADSFTKTQAAQPRSSSANQSAVQDGRSLPPASALHPINDLNKRERAERFIAEIIALKAEGRFREAFDQSDIALLEFPNDSRLRQLNAELRESEGRRILHDAAAPPAAFAAAAGAAGAFREAPIAAPSPVRKREAAPESKAPVALPGVKVSATGVLLGNDGDVHDGQRSAVPGADWRQPQQYQPKLRSEKTPDAVEPARTKRWPPSEKAAEDHWQRAFSLNRKPIATAAVLVGALVVVFFVVARSRPPSHLNKAGPSNLERAAGGGSKPAPNVATSVESHRSAEDPRTPSSAVAPSEDSAQQPLQVPQITAKAHPSSVQAENHKTVEREPEVPQDQSVAVTLPDQLQTVLVISDPPRLPVSIDGATKRETPFSVQLAPGEHHFRVAADGLNDDQTSVVGQGEGQIITVRGPRQNAPSDAVKRESSPAPPDAQNHL